MIEFDKDRSPFRDTQGIRILEASAKRCVAQIEIREEHTNSMGIVHGGLVFTLADSAFGSAEAELDEPYVAQDMSIRFLRPAKVGQTLTAIAEQVHHGRLTSFYTVRVHDENDRDIAYVTASGHLLGKPKSQ